MLMMFTIIWGIIILIFGMDVYLVFQRLEGTEYLYQKRNLRKLKNKTTVTNIQYPAV